MFRNRLMHGVCLGCVVAMSAVCAGGAQAAGFKVLTVFDGKSGGGSPLAGLIRDKAGNLYGTTEQDGGYGGGTVFKILPDGSQFIVHSFPDPGTPNDGSYPAGPLVGADQDSWLAGTTLSGGADGLGTIFVILQDGTELIAHTFSGGSDGENPVGGMIAGTHGNYYGTAQAGGAHGYGVVYKYANGGNGSVKPVYAFTGGNDGANPVAGLVKDQAGNLFGTTRNGGAYGGGTLFKITPSGAFSVIWSFNGGNGDGTNPDSPLTFDPDGNLDGTTPSGGGYGYGAVFSINASGNGGSFAWFTNGSDGGNPEGGVAIDSAGDLFGTTAGGANGYGTVFELPKNGAITTLHAFTGGKDGAVPRGGVILAKDHLYGTASSGGAHGAGTVFKLPQ